MSKRSKPEPLLPLPSPPPPPAAPEQREALPSPPEPPALPAAPEKRGRGRPPLTPEERARRAAAKAPSEPDDLASFHELVGEGLGLIPGFEAIPPHEIERLNRTGARTDFFPAGRAMSRAAYAAAVFRTYVVRLARALWDIFFPAKQVGGADGPPERAPTTASAEPPASPDNGTTVASTDDAPRPFQAA